MSARRGNSQSIKYTVKMLENKTKVFLKVLFQTLKVDWRRCTIGGSRSRDVHKTETDRDVPKNVSRPQCRSLKTLTVGSLLLDVLSHQIHSFLPDIPARLMHCMEA